MRIIDWSSDVCSSDLAAGRLVEEVEFGQRLAPGVDGVLVGHLEGIEAAAQHEQKLVAQHVADRAQLALEAVALAQQARIGIGTAVADARELQGAELEVAAILVDAGRRMVAFPEQAESALVPAHTPTPRMPRPPRP